MIISSSKFEKFRFKKLSAYDMSAYVMSAVLPCRRILFIQFSLQLLFMFSFIPAICDYFNLFRNFFFCFLCFKISSVDVISAHNLSACQPNFGSFVVTIL